MLHVESISKIYGHTPPALRDVTFSVAEGQIYGLIGLSGAGKSTALRAVNLLERPDSGRVLLDGEDLLAKSASELRKVRQKIGMIFQHFNLLSNRTVADNIALPLEIAGTPKPEIAARVKECLRLVSLENKADAYPARLSGGQKQRVAIARAIANRPQLLLADEPTSALDPLTKSEVLSCLLDLNQRLRLSIVIASHEMSVIRKICHRASLFKDGEIVETFDVIKREIHPQTDFGKLFIAEGF
jgi:D-methionine transport system ATP-binding protein